MNEVGRQRVLAPPIDDPATVAVGDLIVDEKHGQSSYGKRGYNQ